MEIDDERTEADETETPSEESTQEPPEESAVWTEEPTEPGTEAPENQNSGDTIKIILIAAICVIAAAIGLAIFFYMKERKKKF